MKSYLKILLLLLIFVLISGCIENNVPNTTDVTSTIQYKILKIQGNQIYYFDEDNFIETQSLRANTYIIESNKTILERQVIDYNWGVQWILYVNVTK